MNNNLWQLEIWIGWKQITEAIQCSLGSARKAMKEKQMPVKYPHGRPVLSKNEYLQWIKDIPVASPEKEHN